MQQLLDGVHKFRREEFGRYRELFQRLSREGQNPHTLFITCADSRVLAELITQSKPGDLFVVKNVGNIVPPADTTGSTNSTAVTVTVIIRHPYIRVIFSPAITRSPSFSRSSSSVTMMIRPCRISSRHSSTVFMSRARVAASARERNGQRAGVFPLAAPHPFRQCTPHE